MSPQDGAPSAELVTIAQVAAALGFSPWRVCKLLREAGLIGRRGRGPGSGHGFRVPLDALRAALPLVVEQLAAIEASPAPLVPPLVPLALVAQALGFSPWRTRTHLLKHGAAVKVGHTWFAVRDPLAETWPEVLAELEAWAERRAA